MATAKELLILDWGGRCDRNYGARQGASRRPFASSGLQPRRCCRDGDRGRSVGQEAIDFTLHIMRELACARLGEIHAVTRPQTTCLPLDIRPERRKTAALSDKAVPNI